MDGQDKAPGGAIVQEGWGGEKPSETAAGAKPTEEKGDEEKAHNRPPANYRWYTALTVSDPLPQVFMADKDLDLTKLPEFIHVFRLSSMGISDKEGTRWGAKPWWAMAAGVACHYAWIRTSGFLHITHLDEKAVETMNKLWTPRSKVEIATPEAAQIEATAAAARKRMLEEGGRRRDRR